MKFDDNPYYSPEKCGLKPFEEFNDADSYEFDIFMIWEKEDDGTLWWDTDSGCSCPSPFDNSDNGHDLKPINKDTMRSFEEALRNHYRMTDSDYNNIVRKVRNHMKMQ